MKANPLPERPGQAHRRLKIPWQSSGGLDIPATTEAFQRLERSFRLSPMRKPIPAPSRLHSFLPNGRVHLRQPFQHSRSFTPANQSGELFHIGKGFANGCEGTVETRALDL